MLWVILRRNKMKVHELKELLDKVMAEDALVCIGHEEDNFYDGETVTGIMIQHQFLDGKEGVKECVKVTIVGDPTIKHEYD